MIRIGYFCKFFNEPRNLYVFSEKARDKEVARMKQKGIEISSIDVVSQ